MKNENDLRVIKTRDNIERSFISLLKTTPLSSISVKDICAAAMCSRNTFYMHYPYKEALYEQILGKCVSSIKVGISYIERAPGESTDALLRRYMMNFLTAMLGAKELLELILKSDSTNTFCCKLTDAVYESIIDGSRALNPVRADSREYMLMARYCASGMVGFALHWLSDTDFTAAEACTLLLITHKAPFLRAYAYLTGSEFPV